jgi:methylthioribose-1-phosphate isomerase
VRDFAARGMVEAVLATGTRPLLQEARLTAWELAEVGIPYRLCDLLAARAGPLSAGGVA